MVQRHEFRLAVGRCLRVAPELFDREEKLLDVFQRPLRARFRSNQPKALPEWFPQFAAAPIVSDRVREVIEQFEPGLNLFVPIDATGPSGIVRYNLLLPQWYHSARAVAFAANDSEVRVSDKGEVFGSLSFREDWAHFFYLNSAAIGGRTLYGTMDVGIVFADVLVEALGDVLPRSYFFVPMGMVHEYFDTPGFRAAAAERSA